MYGQKLPAGWALDSAGNPTDEVAQAKTLVPAAGPRGFGLAFLCSILAGPLEGGKMPLHKKRNPEAEGSEHFFYAIDIRQFVEPDRYYAEIEQTTAEIRALETQPGFDRVTLPGELEWERSNKWRKDGIPLHRNHLNELADVASAMKVAVPW
jgi:ureidoglycolate dehydrogenase (NAD+)